MQASRSHLLEWYTMLHHGYFLGQRVPVLAWSEPAKGFVANDGLIPAPAAMRALRLPSGIVVQPAVGELPPFRQM